MTSVDLELSLLVDVSGSVSSSEYELQIGGYADAFDDASLYENIISQGLDGKIAVNFILWSGFSQQQEVVGWTLIDSVSASQSFAQTIRETLLPEFGGSRPFRGGTNSGPAIDFADDLFFSNDFEGRRKAIEVSGDGNGGSSSTEAARDEALAKGINVINGIVIGTSSSVTNFYQNSLIGGTNADGTPAFVDNASNFQEFGDVVRDVLVRELTPPAFFSVGDASLQEGDSNTAQLTFTVTLSKASIQTTSIDFTTVDGTATGGKDFTAASGTLTFAPGETSKTVTVDITDDNRLEVEETFSLALSNAVNAELRDIPGIGTIVDNDSLQLGSTAVDEGSAAGTVVGELAATDATDTDPFTFSLIADGDGRFALSGNQLQVVDGSRLDFETNNNYTISVQASDVNGNTFIKDFTIILNNIVEPNLPENAPIQDWWQKVGQYHEVDKAKIIQSQGIIDRWWANTNDADFDVTWIVYLEEDGIYEFDADIQGFSSFAQDWDITDGGTISVDSGSPIKLGNLTGSANVGFLKAGLHEFTIKDFEVPNNASVEDVSFSLEKDGSTTNEHKIPFFSFENNNQVDKWWATIGEESIDVTWTVEVPKDGEYFFDLDIEGFSSFGQDWDVKNGGTITTSTGQSFVLDNLTGTAELGFLNAGLHTFKISSFEVPEEPTIEKVSFRLNGNNFNDEVELEVPFVAGYLGANRTYKSDGDNNVHLNVWESSSGNRDSLGRVDFNQETYLIVHGFQGEGPNAENDFNGDSAWMHRLAQAIHQNDSAANVILVDWSEGAKPGFLLDPPYYGTAAMNALTVGDEIAQYLLGKHKDKNGNIGTFRPENVTLIGHSLGGHAVGDAGYEYSNLTEGQKIGNIIALDPAGPGFDGIETEFIRDVIAAGYRDFNFSQDPSSRLSPDDADTVIAIHTSEEFGFVTPLGTLDLYMNPVRDQSGLVVSYDHPGIPNIDIVELVFGQDQHSYAYEVLIRLFDGTPPQPPQSNYDANIHDKLTLDSLQNPSFYQADDSEYSTPSNVRDFFEKDTKIDLSNTSIEENSASGTFIGEFSTVEENPDPDRKYTFTFADGKTTDGRFEIIDGNQLVVADGAIIDYETQRFYEIEVKATDLTTTELEFDKSKFRIDVLDIDEDSPKKPDNQARSKGEPHLSTFDGVGYSFQGAGEFTLVESLNGDLNIQVRYVQIDNNVTVASAVATQVDGQNVVIDSEGIEFDENGIPQVTRRGSGGQAKVTIDGVEVDITSGGSIEVGNSRIYRSSGEQYTIVYAGEDGILNDGDDQLVVDYFRPGTINIVDVYLGDEKKGQITGLLGNLNDNRDDDIALRDGTVLPRPLEFDRLYGDYRDDYRIKDISESLFTYQEGQNPDTFYNPNFPRVSFTYKDLDPEAKARGDAAALAAGYTPGTFEFESAAFDFAVTNDPGFLEGRETDPEVTQPLIIVNTVNTVNTVNQPPTITSNPNFSVPENTTTVGIITAADVDGDNLSFSISNGADQGLFTIDSNSGELTFNNAPNFEIAADADADNNYQVQISVTDGSETVTQDLTVSVTDVDEPNNQAPTIDDAIFTVDENSASGTQVGIINATDPENEALTFAIASGNLDPDKDNNLAFAIDPLTGVITVNDSDDLDFETNPNFNLQVTATDPNNLKATANITVNLTDKPSTQIDPNQSQNGIFTLNGGDSSNIKFTLTNNDTEKVNEVGVFLVDDENGNINGLAPDSDGYLQAALQKAQVIFSAISNRPSGFDLGDIERVLEFNGDARLGFYLISNGTTDTVLTQLESTGTTSLSVFFSYSSNLQVSELSEEGFKLNWSDEIGNSDFTDMELSVELTQDAPTPFTQLQGETQKELIDLRDITGQVSVNAEVHREAAFDNLIGFYQITDINGGIDTTGDGLVNFNPGDAGYKEAALSNRITGLDLLRSDNQQTTVFDGTFDGGSILAPFIVIDGTVDEAINNNAEVYFSFLGANSDGVDHIRLLGDNIFGFEDLPDGGDFDYNDVIVKLDFLTV